MKSIEKFKNLIRLIVSIFASREFAFVYCIIGTLSQTAHTYYLIESISSLDGWSKIFQAAGLSIFISSSLLFFTAIADNDKNSPDYRRIHLGVNLFMIIEIIINAYYYAAHLLLKTNEPNYIDFVFAILVSCLIPVTIKLYAGIIKAKDWLFVLEQNALQRANKVSEVNKQEQIIEEKENQDINEKETQIYSTDSNEHKNLEEQKSESEQETKERDFPKANGLSIQTINVSNKNKNDSDQFI